MYGEWWVTRTLSNGTINWGNSRTSTIQLYEEVPPHISGYYMSYVSLVDVRKTCERAATLNGRVHKVLQSYSVPFLIYKPKSAFFYTCNTVVLYTRLN